MNTFASMNSSRNEFMTKKRSKDIRETSACVKRKMRVDTCSTFFLSNVLQTFKRCKNLSTRRYTALRLNEKDRETLEKIARKYDITISDVLRLAIKDFIDKNESNGST